MNTITRRFEFDSGHRIPHHGGQCAHLHGHRYALEITLAGAVLRNPGAEDDGMVLDFGEVKRLAHAHLVDLWDHAFLVAKEDQPVVTFLASMPNHKTVILDNVPTVENLARQAFQILEPIFKNAFKGRLTLAAIRLYETPNCWADVFSADAVTV